jgi:deoxyribodipyrimidine photo-lyase
MSKHKVNIFWFRRDLRLDDNVGLYEALNGGLPVLPIFIFDKDILSDLEDEDDARLTFIHRQLKLIQDELKTKSTSLHTYYGKPSKVFEALLNHYQIHTVYANEDYEPYALNRDKEVKELLSSSNVNFFLFKDQVIFAKDEVVKDDGDPYLVYTPYSKKWLSRLTEEDLESKPSALYFDNWFSAKQGSLIPLKEMGFIESKIDLPNSNLTDHTLEIYEDERDYPAKDSTSRLGVHLRFGTVSVRKVATQARSISEVFLKELIWREFYMMILYHFPKVVEHNFKSKYDSLAWRNSEADFEKWKQGKTGFPLVDAGMRQLNKTGFMHNRIRMLVASFLTKHLLIDWRWGEAYFARKLLDYELASNNGNWQWAAGTGVDAQPYFRIFNPHSQIKKFDPNQQYIKRWVPEFGSPDYAKEMVDHKSARERALNAFKEAANS